MKLNIFSKKSLLDERQEQILCKLESRGFWLLWWGMLAAIVVQILLGATVQEMVVEWVVFMAACLYIAVECIRNGIWDRHIQANAGANLAGSALAGVCIFLFNLAQRGYWPGALFAAIFTAILCFAALELCTMFYKKRRERLEHTEEEEDGQ